MPDESKLAIFDTNTGELKNLIADTTENRRIALGENENIAIVPRGVYLSSTPDKNKSLYSSSISNNTKVTSDKTNQIEISGPITYDIPQRLASTHASLGKLIFGGQYLIIDDNGVSGYIREPGNIFEFYGQSWIPNLKLELGDNFQILGSNNPRLDGIYKFDGSSGYQAYATKLLGVSLGDRGWVGASGGSINPDLRAIRLQEVSGSVYGVSADIDGCGVYKYGEGVEQSKYRVINNHDVVHSTEVFKHGNASAYFSGGNGTTGPFLQVNSDAGYTFDSSSKYYFKLESFIQFDGTPSADTVILGKSGKVTTTGGVFRLKYDTSPSSFVFDYSTNDSGTDFNNTLSTGALSGVTLTDWNHVQVEFGDVEGRIYVNGTLKAVSSLGSTEEIFTEDNSPFVIGAEDDGTSPVKGYLDGVHLQFAKASEAGSTAMLIKSGVGYDLTGSTSAGGTLNVGTTFSVPTHGSTGEQHTKLLFNMDGLDDCTLFTEDGINVTESIVESYDEDRRIMYISNYGFTGDVSGYTVSGPYVHGYDNGLTVGATAGITGNSHAVRPLVGFEIELPDQGLTLGGIQDVYVGAEEIALVRDIIGSPMTGTSLANGDFVNLFSFGGGSFGTGGTGPNAVTGVQDSLTYFASDSNLGRVQEINDLFGACAGVSLDIFYLVNSSGNNFGIFGREIPSLLSDILLYRNTKRQQQESNVSEIKSVSTVEALKTKGKSKATTNVFAVYTSLPKLSGEDEYAFGSGP